jgi:hypothetical protein
MFYRLDKQPPVAKYKNPEAVEVRQVRRGEKVVPWKPGTEIVFFNSRNIYSDGSAWKWESGGIEWKKDPPVKYIRFADGLVLRKRDPRMMWGGWRRKIHNGGGAVEAVQLYVHSDDVYPRSHKKRGSTGFVTECFSAVGQLWESGDIDSLLWVGDRLEVGFRKKPSNEVLKTIGWKLWENGVAVNTLGSFPSDYHKNNIVLPGHEPRKWEGIDDVVVDASAKDGCSVSSLTITDPQKAKLYFKGFERVPKGCKVEIEHRWYWYRFFKGKRDGVLIFKSNHMPPLKKETATVSLLIDNWGGGRVRNWAYVFSPEDLDIMADFRPVVGRYFKGGKEERCLVAPNPSGLRYASVVNRERIIEARPTKSYKVFSKFSNGKNQASQKMLGGAASKRLPKRDTPRLERLVKMYGDIVPDDYYRYREEEIRHMAEARSRARNDGFLEFIDAAEKSIVPNDLFRILSHKNLLETRHLYGDITYYKPIAVEAIQGSHEIRKAVVDYAKSGGQAWLIYLLCHMPSEFKGAVFSSTFEQ